MPSRKYINSFSLQLYFDYSSKMSAALKWALLLQSIFINVFTLLWLLLYYFLLDYSLFFHTVLDEHLDFTFIDFITTYFGLATIFIYQTYLM